MENPFYAAVFNQPPVVLGQRLKPFSIAHYAALDAIASPFIAGGEISAGDAAVACSLLARPWPDCIEWLWGIYDGSSVESVKQVAMQCDGFVDWAQVASLLRDYISTSTSSRPKLFESERTRRVKGPIVCYLVASLMRYCRMTECQAYNTPFAAAHWYLVEAQGSDDLLRGEVEEHMLVMLKQIRKERGLE